MIPGPSKLAGTTVTVLDAIWHSRGFTAELQRFQDKTGIVVDLEDREYSTDLDVLPGGARPDVTLAVWPGPFEQMAGTGRLVDLSTYLDVSKVGRQVGDPVVSRATSSAGFSWLPVSVGMTGLVWYRRSAFDAAGYQVPTTLGELTALTHRMIADGHTPWCLGADSADASGWTIANWLEALVMRTGGPDLYTRWMARDVAFDDPAVRRAGALLDDIIFTPGSVRGGPAGVKDLDVWGAGLPLASDPPGCLMFEGVDYEPNFYPLPFQRSGDLDYFVLPPADGSPAPPMILGGVAAAAMSDRPEVRELMRYFAGRDWGFEGAKQPLDYFIPPRVNLAVGSCADPEGTLATNAVRVRLCQDARAALASGDWRFGASASLAATIDLGDADHPRGAVLAGMLDYLSEGPGSLDRILHAIDAALSRS